MKSASIIIPTYNRAGLLAKAVESGLRQKLVEIEVLVIDDGSTDKTAIMAKSFDSRVRYIYQENAGACAARNRGLEMSRAEYVKFLDSDDALEPDSIASQVQALEETGKEVSYGLWDEFGANGDTEGLPAPVMPHENPLDSLLDNWWCANFAYLFRRKALDDIRWDTALHSAQDFDFALQAAFAGAHFVHTPVLTGHYNQHDGGRVSRRQLDQWTRDRERVFIKAQNCLIKSNALTPARAHLLAMNYFRLGQTAYSYNPSRFRELIARALAVEPGFLPPRRFHALAVRALGFENAEFLLEIRRRLRRGKIASP